MYGLEEEKRKMVKEYGKKMIMPFLHGQKVSYLYLVGQLL
jgi:hypothetical protein